MRTERTSTGTPLSGVPVSRHSQPPPSAPVPSRVVQTAWFVLLGALIMTVLEGAFRKWLFPQPGAPKYLLYFSKDILFAAILFFPKQASPSPALQVFLKWLRPGCILIVLGAAISAAREINPVGALLSTRALLLLPIIAWLVVPRIAGLSVRWSAGLLAGFALLNFAVATEQNRLPSDHFLNRYADTEAHIVEVESGVRAAGTFAYISGLAVLSTVGIWAGLVLMSLARSQWQRAGAWLALVSGFGCGLASVSRAPIAVGMAIVAGWLLSIRSSVSLVVRSLTMGIVCLGVAYEFELVPALTKLGEGLKERSETAGDTFRERAFGQFGEALETLQLFPAGNGYGTEQVGGQYYATGVAGFNRAESPLPRVVLETGILGLIGYLLVAAGTIMALQKAKPGTSAEIKSGLFATQLFLGAMFFGNIVFNHTASAFVWMLFAAVMAGIGQNADARLPAIVKETPSQSVTANKVDNGGLETAPRPTLRRAIGVFWRGPVRNAPDKTPFIKE